MAQLVVRNLPDDVKERLKRRAKQHGRSLEAEVREILMRAPDASPNDKNTEKGWASKLVERMRPIGVTDEDMAELNRNIAELRRDWRMRDIDLDK